MRVEQQTESKNTMAKPNKNCAPVQAFRPGQAVSMPTRSGAGTLMRSFYCVDECTSTTIDLLSKRYSFSNWERGKDSARFQDTPYDLGVVQITRGWIAIRGYTYHHRVLTHHLHAVPLLFATPEMAQAAAELSCPNLHPALSWMVKRTWNQNEKALTRSDGPELALGWIEWARVLPELIWLFLRPTSRAA
jgi:hypothetical protein